MDEISEHAWIISIVGDFLTLFGAYWTARAVILTKQQADAISSVPYGGPHPRHAAALLNQSRAARVGLVCVAVGAGFQIVSKLIEEFFS
jgi:hypothetical protein